MDGFIMINIVKFEGGDLIIHIVANLSEIPLPRFISPDIITLYLFSLFSEEEMNG
jgi:hypothetical protein